jgi:GPI ethanolamine phosphate transferase 1
VEFDTVFNRSQLTYSWGSPDILPMFAKGAKPGKVFTSSYDPNDEDFSRGSETELLDIWVFDRVKEFLGDPEVVARLRKHDRLILFLHLLGMDTVGHVYKPHSAYVLHHHLIIYRKVCNMSFLFQSVYQKFKNS